MRQVALAWHHRIHLIASLEVSDEEGIGQLAGEVHRRERIGH